VKCEKRIPFGIDNQKRQERKQKQILRFAKDDSTRKTRATAKEEADSLRE
jgi:hypothetical protein